MKKKMSICLLSVLFMGLITNALFAQTSQIENYAIGGPYAGIISSPFNGIAFYGNGDMATGSLSLTNATGLFTVAVTGASNTNSTAKIDLYIDGSKVGDFSFNGTAVSTDSKSISITSTGNSKSVALILSTDDGSNDTFVDKIVFSYQGNLPPSRPAPTLPITGAFTTGVYRNMFVESGKDATVVSNKLNQMWNQYFVNGNASNEKLYYPVGSDMAYILDTGNDDIRSEGMSYGMMICVQLNKRAEFDKLWKFAKTYSQHPSGNARQGLFSWKLSKTNFSKLDDNSAPDGEEYYATALFFAHARWGSGSGILNYRAEADYILDNMVNKPIASSGGCPTNLVDLNEKQIVFGICGNSATFTDPSYHLPAFYEIWARYAKNNKQLWADMATKSRTYLLPNAAHPVTGLMPDYSEFNGTPKNEGDHGKFEYDAWRNIMNMGFDQAWFKTSTNVITPLINRQIDFFKNKPNYPSLWTLDGTFARTNDHSPGLVACNAVGSLALADAKVWPFIDEFFETSIPSGQFRYYDGLLYMMSYMHLSGNFKAYKLDTTNNPIETYTITASAGSNGSISPAGNVQVSANSNQTFTIVPNQGYEINTLKVNGVTINNVLSHTFTNVTTNQAIAVTFKPIQIAQSYVINASSDVNGSISPAGNVQVTTNSNKTFTITPNQGYEINTLKVNGVTVSNVSNYTFTNVTSNNTISVTFKLISTGGGNNCLLARFGVPRNTPLPTINAGYTYAQTIGTNFPNLSHVNNISINWALSSGSLWQLSMNTSTGNPAYYLDLKNNIQNFNSVNPSVTFANSGIQNLDGNTYYINIVDTNNIVLVEKTGKHAIYFSKSNATISGCSSARVSQDKKDITKVTIFPNPANNLITINVMDEIIVDKVNILDLTGRILQTQLIDKSNDLISITIESLPIGSYILHLYSNNEIIKRNIIKQ